MAIIWQLEKGTPYGRFLPASLNPNNPTDNIGLSKVIKQLEKKGFLVTLNLWEYPSSNYPLISQKRSTAHKSFKPMVKNYFDGSAQNVLVL